jgi:hypothetical protein
MKEAVLDLISSYEDRISVVEKLLTASYQVAATSNESLAELDKEREGLKTKLQEALARNCSLRRKDFNSLMARILFDSKGKKKEIEEEQRRVRKRLKEYLDEQKSLASFLKEQLVKFTQESAGKDSLEATIGNLKVTYQDKGQQILALIRNFQLHLEVFQREQEEINHKLQRLVDRGESLKIEELRQLQAAKAHQDREVERELRREDVERLLAHFRQQRHGNVRRKAVVEK